MKILQLNTWSCRLEKQVLGLLKQEAADIVCVQEVIDVPGNAAFFVSLPQLQHELGYPNVSSSPVMSFRLMNKTATFGNAILSRFSFRSQNTIFTNLEFKENFDFDETDYNIRNLQHVVLEINGKAVNVLNHHGHHVKTHKNGNTETLRQMDLIGKYIDKLEGPIILAGDFNLDPLSESIRHINKRLTNLSVKYNLKTTRTTLTHKAEVCDYIFVNDQIKIESFRALDEIVSDHKALVLEFDV